jgi:hypothetical protein
VRETDRQLHRPSAIRAAALRKSAQPTSPVQPTQSVAPENKQSRARWRPTNDTVDSPVNPDAESLPVSLRSVLGWWPPLLRDLEFTIRTIFVLVFLSVAYRCFDGFHATDFRIAEGGQKSIAVALGLFGVLLFFAAALLLLIVVATVFRAAAEGNKRIEEWPGFGITEWFGSVAVIAFSVWIASLPGLLLGTIAWWVTGWLSILLVLTSISVFAIAPVCLISALLNESVTNIVSTDVVKTFSSFRQEWHHLYIVICIIGAAFVLGTLVLYLPSFIFCLIGAVVQVAAVVSFAVATGLHVQPIYAAIQR